MPYSHLCRIKEAHVNEKIKGRQKKENIIPEKDCLPEAFKSQKDRAWPEQKNGYRKLEE
jgi:hypothetical protein